MELRLLLFPECDRSCEGCCNKGFDLESLEAETCYSQYDRIMLTGGEPMLRPDIVKQAIDDIREQDKTVPIILYTAKIDDIVAIGKVLFHRREFGEGINGLTVTLHEPEDVESFKSLQNSINMTGKAVNWSQHSFRLNVFKGVDVSRVDTVGWIVKPNIEWIEDCPLPSHEVFKKYERVNNEEQ